MTLLQSLQSHEWMGLRFHNLSHEPYRMNPSSGKGFALRASTLISLPIFIVEAIASIAFATIASAHLLCSGFKNSSAKAWVIASYNHFLFSTLEMLPALSLSALIDIHIGRVANVYFFRPLREMLSLKTQ